MLSTDVHKQTSLREVAQLEPGTCLSEVAALPTQDNDCYHLLLSLKHLSARRHEMTGGGSKH